MRLTLIGLAILSLPGAVLGQSIVASDSAYVGNPYWTQPSWEPHGAFRNWREIVRGQHPDADDADEEPIETDRPDFTETSSSVGRGRLQVESGYLYVHDRSAGVTSDQHFLPESLLRYGLSDKVELRLEWEGYLFSRQSDHSKGLNWTEDGGTDLVVGFKTELTKQRKWIPEAAMITTLAVPTGRDVSMPGSPIFTSDQVDPVVNLCYSWKLSEKVVFGGSTGVWWTAEGGDHFIRAHQSLMTDVSITDRLKVFCEWFAFSYSGSVDHRPEHYFQAGPMYLVTPNIQLDWHTGFGITEAADDLFTGVGFSFRL